MSQSETDDPAPPPPPLHQQRRVTFEDRDQESTQGPPPVSIPGPERLRAQLCKELGATFQEVVPWTEGSSHATGTSDNPPSWSIGDWEAEDLALEEPGLTGEGLPYFRGKTRGPHGQSYRNWHNYQRWFQRGELEKNVIICFGIDVTLRADEVLRHFQELGTPTGGIVTGSS